MTKNKELQNVEACFRASLIELCTTAGVCYGIKDKMDFSNTVHVYKPKFNR